MKVKSLFDHIRQTTAVQNPKYWETLTDSDKKTWSNYMVNRFLSMKMEWTDFVNEIQKLKLDSYSLYVVYSNTLPKGKQYLKYIKGKKDNIYNKQVVQKIAEYFKCSEKESITYISLLPKKEIREIISKYGYTDKELKQMGI